MLMNLVLVIVDMETIHWYVDASYGTHSDCKGHTGMMMTLGSGAAMSMPKAHKLNTKKLHRSRASWYERCPTRYVLGQILY